MGKYLVFIIYEKEKKLFIFFKKEIVNNFN